MDILAEARLALLAQRARLGSSETPDAAQVLEMATLGGATAVGIGDRVGSLEVGKEADLAAFTLDRSRPTPDPVAAAVFSISGADARFVMVAGQTLVRGGVLMNANSRLANRMEELSRALENWRDTSEEAP